MDELSGDSFVFKYPPGLETATQVEGYIPFDIGDGYRGVGKLALWSGSCDDAHGLLIAYSAEGETIFRGGVDYYRGIGMLGQTSGSFQRAKEHQGKRIGRKMAIIGLEILRRFVEQEHLELHTIGLKTSPGSSMARIAEYLGLVDSKGDGTYGTSEFPDIAHLMQENGIKQLPLTTQPVIKAV